MARLDGTARKDLLHGTLLGDEIYGLAGDDILYGYGGPDFLNGGPGDDRLFGGAGNDDLYGAEGNDWLSGGAGDDRLDGGPGADRMSGGSGNDAYFVDDPGDQVIEAGSFGRFDLGGGIDTVLSYLASYTLPSGVENLYLQGAARDGTGNALANEIHGNELDNVLSGLAGDDALVGAAGNDTLLGGSGNDILIGGPGNDVMEGGSGDDTYYVEDDGDRVVETSTFTFRDLTLRVDAGGHDLVYSSAFAFRLPDGVEDLTLTGAASWGFGNALDNVLTGDAHANLLQGEGGNDRLDGGAGPDLMKGGTGNDTYIVDDGQDEVVEFANEGTDTVVSFLSSYTLAPNVERLRLEGFAVAGTGNDLDNEVTGNELANVLDGKAGRDTLFGGGENDTLTGGDGQDTFVFVLTGKTTGPLVPAESSPGIDTITDFVHGTDKIGVAGTGSPGGSLGSDMFVASATPTATKHMPTILYNTTTGALSIDYDGFGTGAPEQFAILSGHPILTSTDFILLS